MSQGISNQPPAITLSKNGALDSNTILIQAGHFEMGENGVMVMSLLVIVWLSDYHVDRFEVTIRLWSKIRSWAKSNGYEFSVNQNYPLEGPSWWIEDSTEDFPMNNINWYDAIKWCNARSEYYGLEPVYYINNQRLKSIGLVKLIFRKLCGLECYWL